MNKAKQEEGVSDGEAEGRKDRYHKSRQSNVRPEMIGAAGSQRQIDVPAVVTSVEDLRPENLPQVRHPLVHNRFDVAVHKRNTKAVSSNTTGVSSDTTAVSSNTTAVSSDSVWRSLPRSTRRVKGKNQESTLTVGMQTPPS